MGRLYDIIQAHIDDQPHGASIRRVAKAIGVSPTTVSNWRNITELPSRENMEAIAEVTGTTYDDVFYAASVDAGYIVETDASLMGHVESEANASETRRAARRGIPRLPK